MDKSLLVLMDQQHMLTSLAAGNNLLKLQSCGTLVQDPLKNKGSLEPKSIEVQRLGAKRLWNLGLNFKNNIFGLVVGKEVCTSISVKVLKCVNSEGTDIYISEYISNGKRTMFHFNFNEANAYQLLIDDFVARLRPRSEVWWGCPPSKGWTLRWPR